MKTGFPFLDLSAQFQGIRDEVWEAVRRVFESQHFILGEEVLAFERAVATLVGVREAVGCASGSDALLIALLALGIGPADEVITTPFTFAATAGAIARSGAKPVFVDIRPDTFSIDPNLIESSISERTRAIIPVHLFGLPADLAPILKLAHRLRLAVVEDAAQAIGAAYQGASTGGLGTLGCFSFFPSKNLGGAGDGGMITTDDAELADRARLIRAHGSRRKYYSEVLGMNSRLDALQAAVLQVKLRHLPDWTAARRAHAARYRALFTQLGLEEIISLPVEPPGYLHAYNQFVIRCPDRDRLRGYLSRQSLPTEIYYPFPLHLQPAFAYLRYAPGQFPEAEAACRAALALPIYPELREEHQASVVSAIAQFYREGNRISGRPTS